MCYNRVVNNHLEQIQTKTEKKAKERLKKKRLKMKVSGKSVFKLAEIIRKRSKR